MAEKAISLAVKGEKYETDIKDTLKALEDKIQVFKEQAAICDSQRLGRVEESVSSELQISSHYIIERV